MAPQGRIVVWNKASRWFAVVYWLIWLFGLYGVIATRALPPTRWQDFAACLSIVLLPVLAVRSLRARVVLDDRGFTSHDELRNQTFTWDQVSGFSDRGTPIQNKVGADLTDGRWVRIQYHPFAADMVRQLQTEREKFGRQAMPPGLA